MSVVELTTDDKTKDVASEDKQSADGKTSDCETSNANRKVAMVIFKSRDGTSFNVEEKVARKFMFADAIIKGAIQGNTPITLEEIDSDILTIMIEWAEHHVNDLETEIIVSVDDDEVKRTDDIAEWDDEHLSLPPSTLFRLVKAARCRQMKSLLNVALKKSANLFKGKTVDQLREMFKINSNIENSKVKECTIAWFSKLKKILFK